jgi:hypothetical protein
MKLLRNVSTLLAASVLLAAYSVNAFAQEKDNKQRETTLTGCLNKAGSDMYSLTDETTGAKTTVTGPSDLEKHSANHKVTLTGTTKTDASGKSVFEVSKIQHVSTSCKAPSQ